MKNKRHVVLIAVVGTSPAVLTETVWALVTKDQPIIPDEIIVLTTTTGRDKIKEQILSHGENSVWNKMLNAMKKKKLPIENKLSFGSSNSIQIFSRGNNDLSDITTPEENTAAADFILKTIRAYSENPNTQILASLAGGRKTMSALMLSCMTLLGRDDDKVLHVLINEPFDGGVEPSFYFPDGKSYISRKTGKSVSSTKAKIDLIDLPFVKVRSLYEGKFGKRIPSYGELVAKVDAGTGALMRPTLRFDFADGRFFIAEKEMKLSESEFVTLGILLSERCNDFKELAKRLNNLHSMTPVSFGSYLHRFTDGSRFNGDEFSALDDLRKVLASLRVKLSKQRDIAPFVDEILPKRKCLVTYPTSRTSADVKNLLEQLKK